MKAWCPKCGSAARFVSQEAQTLTASSAVFRCEDPNCGGDVLAEIHFGMRKAPGDHCFSTAAGDPSANLATTDC